MIDDCESFLQDVEGYLKVIRNAGENDYAARILQEIYSYTLEALGTPGIRMYDRSGTLRRMTETTVHYYRLVEGIMSRPGNYFFYGSTEIHDFDELLLLLGVDKREIESMKTRLLH